jgi:Transglutaminase-like superfamily
MLLSPAVFPKKIAVNPYRSIDNIALQLPDSLTTSSEKISRYICSNFKSESDKSRAIFVWVATNIGYDVDNMFAINIREKREDKISKVLKSRKGICENFAALFVDVCLKSGLKAIVVEGYCKQNNYVEFIPHAWCAAMIDSVWYLFDPTWGSGYLMNGKFYRKLNNDYFKVNPLVLIKTHMPFDYLWQFLNYPISSQEFYEGKTQSNTSKPFFNYKDSIFAYEKQDQIQQLTATALRIEKNGLRNSLLFERLQYIKIQLENERQGQMIGLYNEAYSAFNEGVRLYNAFVEYRNKQFLPKKSDMEIQQMLDDAKSKFKQVRVDLKQIKEPDATLFKSIISLSGMLDDTSKQLVEQEDWLKSYFKKSEWERKSMFYERKMSLFGIPIN